MRTLTEQEANELGCFFNSADISGGTGAFIEATVSQLAELGVGTPCGLKSFLRTMMLFCGLMVSVIHLEPLRDS
jgi:hypothetical protein